MWIQNHLLSAQNPNYNEELISAQNDLSDLRSIHLCLHDGVSEMAELYLQNERFKCSMNALRGEPGGCNAPIDGEEGSC